jgi:alpha-ketoglutarate-dependent taurine dioxygenase
MAVSITNLSDPIGAEVIGADLSRPANAETAERLRRAFVDRALLVIRDQALEAPQFLSACRLFGEPVRQHLEKFNLPDCPDVATISNQEKTREGKINVRGVSWHTDHSFQPEPPKATALFAVSLPSKGGDTSWAHMGAAYEALPASLRAEVDGLDAVHAYTETRMPPSVAERIAAGDDDASDGVVHPLIRTHPENGRRTIYLNPLRVRRFRGMTPESCAHLIERLVAHSTRPEFVYTHRWRPGDMVIWDNRCCIHKATTDYDFQELRLLYRIILAGDKPH